MEVEMEKKQFGDSEASLFILENDNGVKLTLTDIGASIVGLSVPQKNEQDLDIVLGYDDPESYFRCKSFFGTSVGRVANRIGDACFTLNGTRIQLEKNDDGGTLHGGFSPWSNRIWEAAEIPLENSVVFKLESPDGDQGFPGAATVRVKYSLTDADEVRIDYRAVADKATVFNLTNHAYFNIDGHDAGPEAISNQYLQLYCEYFTETDGNLITTGKLLPVAGTPLDFRAGKRIGADLGADFDALTLAGGYDHNYVIDEHSPEKAVARLWSEKSGVEILTFTDLPGIQFYSGNHMEDEKGKGGAGYVYRGAVCLETQFFPNAPNRPEFPSCVFEAGEAFSSTTTYRIVVK
jgi:aldose 1-epimerase